MVSSLSAGHSEVLVGILHAIPPSALHALMAVSASALTVAAVHAYRFSAQKSPAPDEDASRLSIAKQ